MLARFESDGLATRERSAEDGRRQVVRLTPRGREVFALLDERSADDVARLRLLHVEPGARGAGVGAALVDACVRFAEEAGYAEIMLWTTALQRPAHRVYARAGFVLTEEEPPVSRFGDTVHGQVWRRKL
ncbi:GNAT family N-acetyltransferase [Actinomadura sp. WAC 06369]|uniref:GNAT family N-acetyltransferase n=1 Tax=Actinomadura sp. WAC 06369 TaxID=2203193 RepID=UPI000F77A1BD|nr:GNAT family N-acetyltransferase [Actinomadura sp. WAC 06369]RSN69160.1 hypothetical protein DMH08_09140 [Actinomadura sp. WAC 06369]